MKTFFFQKIAGVFIANRELGILTIAGIIIFGAIGFAVMPKQYNPEIVAPAFRIVTEYPNASVDEVYERITRPLEDVVQEIPVVDDIFAETRNGQSIVTVTFDIGQDKENAKINLVQKMRSNMDKLPSGVREPLVQEIDTDDVAIVTFALTSTQFSETSLRKFAIDIANRFKMVEGAAKVEVVGGRVQELRITLNPQHMEYYGVGVSQVTEALRANNVHLIQSQLEGDRRNIPVRVWGGLDGVEQVREVVVAPSVRIDDIATVTLEAQKRTSYTGFSVDDNRVLSAVFIGIAKHAGTNATVIAQNIREEFSNMVAHGEIPQHVRMEVVRDDGAVAAEEITGLTTNLIISITIVTLVLLFFLSTRSAIIVATAIPLSLMSVFGFGMLFGQTINRITLFALILSLGLLVDSATVVVENMVRQLRAKKSYEEDAEVITRSTAEVAVGLIMSTVTTVLAFIPMAFVGGMMGPYMGPIPFFVPIALIASLVIALTINPFLGHLLLSTQKNRGKSENVVARFVERGQGIAQKIVRVMQHAYVKFLTRMFHQKKARRRLVWSVAILLLVAMVLPAVGIVKFRMLPKADRNQFFVYIDTPSMTSVHETQKVAQKITGYLRTQSVIESVQVYTAIAPVVDFNGLFKGSDARRQSNHATLKVNLVDADSRAEKSEDIATAVRQEIVEIAQERNATITIVEDPPGPPVLATFQLKVQGRDYEDQRYLRVITQDVLRMTQGIDGIVDVDTTLQEHGVERVYKVDTQRVMAQGLSIAEVMQTLDVALSGMHVDVFHAQSGKNRYPQEQYISLRFPTDAHDETRDLTQIMIPTEGGYAVSLQDLLIEQDTPVDVVLKTDARRPTVYINGEMEGRSVVYASIDALKALLQYKLPSGEGEVVKWNLFGATYKDSDGKMYDIRIGGEWELTLEVFRDMGIAFAVAIIVIYFVLVAQFASLRIPLYILATIPLALIGVFPGFALLGFTMDTYFTATAMIGVIALAGIVVNNAIIYLEYVFQLRKEDMPRDMALIEAGKTRLLPIALTSLTTILGSLTIISDPVWEGLAWAIILGLSLSAFLTLIMLPLIYRKFERGS